MSHRLKLILTAVLSVIVTFFATSYLVRNSMLNAMSTKFVETEAFNDVGRLEFYDTDEFMSKFNQGLAGHPAYPIELQIFKDPDWGALSELLHK